STAVSYRSVLRTHVLPELGATRLVDLTPAQIAAHLARLRAMPSRRHPGARANGGGTERGAGAVLMPEYGHHAAGRGAELVRLPEAPSQSRVRPVEVDGDIATPGRVAAMAAAMPEHLGVATPPPPEDAASGHPRLSSLV